MPVYYRGVVHVHSAYSHDGASDLAAFAAQLERERLHFALLTEHVEDFTRARYADYVEACRVHSTPTRLLVPGLEYTFVTDAGRVEILLVGTGAYTEAAAPADLWRHPSRADLLAILPHPRKFGPLPSDMLAEFDLVEVWNLRYDGGGFPPAVTINLFRDLSQGTGVFAVCGPDYHEPGDGFGPVTVVSCAGDLDEAGLLMALKRGAFHTEYRRLRLPSDLAVGRLVLWRGRIERVLRHAAYLAGRWVVRRGLVRRLLPPRLKAGLRRAVR